MANDFFTKTGVPATQSPGSSSLIRNEFALIEQAFDKLPALAGNNSRLISVNADGDRLEARDIDAQDIANIPFGNIVATTVQDAINELDAEKTSADSPAFSGTPTGPTAAPDTATTQLATTAFVIAQAASVTPLADTTAGSVGTSKRYARADHAHPKEGGYEFIASGTIGAAGLAVTLLADGTVAAIGGALSQKVAFVSSTVEADSLSAAYDETLHKVIVLYRSSTSLYAVIGTVSAGTIAFGSPALVSSSTYQYLPRLAVETGSGKFVVAYGEGGASSRTIYAAVGSILGTSVSFGSALPLMSASSGTINSLDICYCHTPGRFVAVFSRSIAGMHGGSYVLMVNGSSLTKGNLSSFHAVSVTSNYMCCAYDSVNNRVVVFYNRADVVYAAVGQVSDLSITWGTEVTCYSARGYYLAAAFDAFSGKTVTTFVNTATDSRGRAIVGTVSGDSISFGSPVEFSVNAVDGAAIAYDSTNHKLLISYGYADTPQYIKAVTGEVSGTTMTFGAAVSVSDSGYSGNTHDIVYDADTNSAVVVMRELSNYGYARVASMEGGDLSYASMNFLGLSEAGAVNGANVMVTLPGGVNTHVSGLTTGFNYYVDNGGALTTETGGNAKVGKALSSTSILVTGG